MKINLILSLLFLFQSPLHAQDAGSFAPGTGFGGGMYGGIGPDAVKIENLPTITIKIDNDKSLSCDLDGGSKTYICPNSGNPVLVKYSPFGFVALGRDKDKSPTMPVITNVEAEGKVLYEAPSLTGYPGMGMMGFKTNDTKDLSREYSTKVMMIDGFFGASPKNKGSEEYEQITKSFIDEKLQLQESMNRVYREPNYSVELEDGQKINCERGTTRPLNNDQRNYESQMGVKIQCGSFKCDPVKVDGKEYEATMLYESSPGSFAAGAIHLFDKNGIGPKKSIKKITSSSAQTPLVDNSYSLENAESSYYKNYVSSALPVSLKEDRQKIIQYKDPMFEQLVAYYKNVCNDNKALDDLLEGKKKLVSKLADLELAEFIQVLGNGSLVGQYVDPTLAPGLGCLYQGVYLNEEAAKNLERLKKNIHPDREVDQTISLDRATELFNKAANMKDIAWKYKPDGCYARAHLMARRFEAEGVRVDKVWIKGDLYVPGTEPLIQWNFHVAPIVYVDDGKGKIQKMVIDPSLFAKPVTVEEWDHKMSKRTAKGSVVTAFPFPENSAFMERSTLSFSSSDPYLPRDTIDMNETDKMNMADSTMRMYKMMEPN